jgi:hypothetical protein
MMSEPAAFAARYGRWALVAGASEGIGASFAKHIAAAGINVALVARRADPLDALADEVRTSSPVSVRTATVDLTSPTMIEQLAPVVADVEVGLVVHNAGSSMAAGFFLDRPVDDALHLLDLNARSVVLLAHHFAPPMVARGHGGLILMSSMASAAGCAYNAAYSASKAYSRILAEGLWMELGQRGVDVLSVPAGLTDTPAMRRSGIIRDDTGMEAMSSDDVAAEALAALGGPSPVYVPGAANAATATALWPVPRIDLIAGMTAGNAVLYGLEPLTPPSGRAQPD